MRCLYSNGVPCIQSGHCYRRRGLCEAVFRFWIPEDLAYKGRPGAPAGMLVFDVELLSIK